MEFFFIQSERKTHTSEFDLLSRQCRAMWQKSRRAETCDFFRHSMKKEGLLGTAHKNKKQGENQWVKKKETKNEQQTQQQTKTFS